MGIRVHKILGYGIQDLQTKKKNPEDKYTSIIPNDPRWDYANYQVRDEDRMLKADFMEWLQSNPESLKELAKAEYIREDSAFNIPWLLETLKEWDSEYLYGLMYWNSEFGLSNVVIFTLPFERWTRYDDIIDYYEETRGGGSCTRATFLKNSTGIYPFEGTMKRFRDPTPEVRAKVSKIGNLIRNHAPKALREKEAADITFLQGGDYNQLVGRWDSKTLPPFIKDPDVLKHFLEDWRPTIPFGILALMEYLGCFPNPTDPGSMLNSLRPMIYVYWS